MLLDDRWYVGVGDNLKRPMLVRVGRAWPAAKSGEGTRRLTPRAKRLVAAGHAAANAAANAAAATNAAANAAANVEADAAAAGNAAAAANAARTSQC